MSVFVAVMLVSAQATIAQQPSAAAATEAPKAKPKKICKTDPEISGSRMMKRLCLTEEEWAQRSQSMYDSARAGTSSKAQDH